jgi:hypothetical protein
MRYSGAWGKLIHEKNMKLKISWHCPFNMYSMFITEYDEIGWKDRNVDDSHAGVRVFYFHGSLQIQREEIYRIQYRWPA